MNKKKQKLIGALFLFTLLVAASEFLAIGYLTNEVEKSNIGCECTSMLLGLM